MIKKLKEMSKEQKNTTSRKLLPIHREREFPIMPRICSKACGSSR